MTRFAVIFKGSIGIIVYLFTGTCISNEKIQIKH